MANILIIEDDSALRSVLRHQIEQAGHVVREAPNGELGLTLYQQEAPDLVITDLYMPEKDGIEVIQAVKSDRPNSKIIAITGGAVHDSGGTMVAPVAQRLGADRILTKPFSQQTLLTTIQDLCQLDGRRRFPRFHAEFSVDFFQKGTFCGKGRGCDLSLGGCSVESLMPMEKGDYVSLNLYLPGQHEATTPLKIELAAVRWAVRQHHGLEFIKLLRSDHHRMQRYLETLQMAPS